MATEVGNGYAEVLNMPARNYALVSAQKIQQGGYCVGVYFNFQTTSLETSTLNTLGSSIVIDTPTLNGTYKAWSQDDKYSWSGDYETLKNFDFEALFANFGAVIENSTP